MAYVGGLRDRLITENIRNLIEDHLEQLDWFEANNQLRQNDLTIISTPVDSLTEIEPNLVSVVSEDMDYQDAEMGSRLSEFRVQYAVDIYAEDDATGKHLAGDVRAILEGRFSTLGRADTPVDIYDLTQATPTVIFTVDLENISMGKQRFYNKPFEKYWWTIVFDVVDLYATDED